MKIILLTLIATLAFGTLCFADDDEDNAPPITRKYTLGQEPPKPAPKPKVIVKEKIVEKFVCPSGSSWNLDARKCQDEDGNDVVVAPKKKAQAKKMVADDGDAPVAKPQHSVQIPDDKYIYPRTKVRVRPGQCIMTGENIVCDYKYINASDGTWIGTKLDSSSMLDNIGNAYKVNKGWGCGYRLAPGGSCDEHLQFNFVDTNADSLTLTFIINARGTTDLVKFVNFPIMK